MITRLGKIALAIAASGGAGARANEYMLLIYETPQQVALRTDPGRAGTAYWSAFAAIGSDLAKSGVLRGGAALATGAAATVGVGSAASGPTGYFIVEVADLAAARTWAAKIPAATTGRVEVPAYTAAKTGM